MSRRPPAPGILAVLLLLAAGLSPTLVTGAAAQPPFGSHVFEANAIVVPDAQSYPVYSGSTVAQSFLVNETYYLENVTLRVLNNGNKFNALNVSIHPDNPSTHYPVMGTTLAYALEITPTNASGPADFSWPMNPSPLLLAGQTYWIVAENGGSQAANGYDWYSTNGTTYPEGQALLGPPFWAGLPVDMYFINFGQEEDANLSAGMSVSSAQAQPGQSVTFTVFFNNSGASPSPRVWVNDTVPPELTGPTLTFPGLQPVSAAAFPNLVFTNVPNGPHSFQITAEIAIGTAPGTLVTNGVSLAFVDLSNVAVQAGSASASVRVGLVTKQLYLGGTSSTSLLLTTAKPTSASATTTTINPGSATVAFNLAPPLARPFDARNASAVLWLKSQKVPPQTYHLTLGLLDNGTVVASLSPSFQITASTLQAYRFSFAASGTTFGAGDRIGLAVTNLGGGGGSTDALILAYNGTNDASRLEIGTDTYVNIRSLSLGNQAGPTSMWSTLDSLVAQANVSDPFGSSRIAGAWINITSPSGPIVASGPMSLTQTDPSSLSAWKQFRYTLAPPLATGRYVVVVNAMEDNGVTTLAQAFADVAIPTFAFEASASQSRVQTGDTVAFYLWYNNTGTGPAGRAWINDTLPAGLTFVGSNLTVSSVSGSTYTWALTNVSVGSHRLEVDVLVTGTAVNWVQNDATLTYQDMSGHPLGALDTSTTLYLNGPVIELTLTSTPAAMVHANETVTYQFTLANTGDQAGQVWLNTTLPSAFAYVSSNAGLLGGTETISGTHVNFAFPSMPANTTWIVLVTTVAGPSLVRNGTYTLSSTLADTSTSGTPMPIGTANQTLTDASPWFPSPGLWFLRGQVPPGSLAPAEVVLPNVGNEAAPWVWVNLTLDPRLTIADATAPYTSSGGLVGFILHNVTVGTAFIFLNLTIDPSATDRASLTMTGTLDAEDAYGNPLPTVALPSATVFVFAAQISLIVTPSAPVFEPGVASTLTLYSYNWGSDSAANLWLNATLPAGLVYLNDTLAVLPALSGSTYSWHLTDVVPGPFTAQLRLEPRTTVPNGTAMPLKFTYEYTSSNSVLMPGGNLTVNGVTVAPDLELSITSSSPQVKPSADLVYTLRVTNKGRSAAETVSLVDIVDSRLQVLYYNATAGASVQNQTYNWTFSDLAPGESQVVNLTVQVAPGMPANTLIANAFEVTYTNSVGVDLGTLRSAAVTVTVQQDLTPYVFVGIGAAACSGAALVAIRRRKVDIEEVFLVYRDGVLISHLSRTLLREKDEDVLSGMLTAVQEFVREAFQYGEHRDLQQMDFGDYRILIERGKYVFLAIVYSGRESIAIHRKVRAVIAKIEHDFGPALENWDGDMEQVMGARDVIRDTLLGTGGHNLAAKTVAEKESD